MKDIDKITIDRYETHVIINMFKDDNCVCDIVLTDAEKGVKSTKIRGQIFNDIDMYTVHFVLESIITVLDNHKGVIDQTVQQDLTSMFNLEVIVESN